MTGTKGKRGKGYRRVTYPAALRMARLVDEMPRHGIGQRLASVAESLGVDPQTIRRYVRAMAGEFVTEDGEQPQFVIEKKGGEDWLVRRPRLGEGSETSIYHLVSVYFALEYFKMLGQNVVALSVEEVLEKVELLLPKKHRELLADLPRKFYNAPWAPKDYSRHVDILEDVIQAVVYQKVIEMTYKPAGRAPEQYLVRPLTLLHHKGGFYLVAKPSKRKKPVYFNIERIREIKLTEKKFDYPKSFHPAQMLDGAFGIFTGPAKVFKLKFAPTLSEYIAGRKWHRSQKIRTRKDGSVVLTLKVTDSEEVRSWIRSFGKKVKVLG